MKEEKSAWDDISRVWKRVVAVFAACGALAAFLVNGFGFPMDKTILYVSVLGIMLLLVSFYVDKQTKYIREEIKESKKATDTQLLEHTKEPARVIDNVSKTLDEVTDLTLDTRKDTLRIQLLMIMRDQPDNTDTILKLAETYFVKLKGDWYMTVEFLKWAKAHDIIIPDEVFKCLNKSDSN